MLFNTTGMSQIGRHFAGTRAVAFMGRQRSGRGHPCIGLVNGQGRFSTGGAFSFIGLNIFAIEEQSTEIVELILGQKLRRPSGVLPGTIGPSPFSFPSLAFPTIPLPPVRFSPLMVPPVFRNDPQFEQIHFRILGSAFMLTSFVLASFTFPAILFLPSGNRLSGHSLFKGWEVA